MSTIGKYSYLLKNTTTVVSAVPCTLVKAILTDASASGKATIYDNTAGSGTKVATIDLSEVKKTVKFNCILKTGCTVVMDTDLSNPKLTVVVT